MFNNNMVLLFLIFKIMLKNTTVLDKFIKNYDKSIFANLNINFFIKKFVFNLDVHTIVRKIL